jgi:hypothetical protein
MRQRRTESRGLDYTRHPDTWKRTKEDRYADTMGELDLFPMHVWKLDL